MILLAVSFQVGLNAILKHKVSKVALDNFMKILRGTEFLYYVVLDFYWSFGNANFDEFGRKLILRELNIVAFNFVKDIFRNFKRKLWQNLWDNEVSKRILHIQ